MTDAEKITSIKAMLDVTDADTQLGAYLSLAKAEILGWLYNGSMPDGEVPAKYEVTQIMAVVAGFSTKGAEGQTSHSENGIARQWKYESMVAFIRAHVIPYAVVI